MSARKPSTETGSAHPGPLFFGQLIGECKDLFLFSDFIVYVRDRFRENDVQIIEEKWLVHSSHQSALIGTEFLISPAVYRKEILIHFVNRR